MNLNFKDSIFDVRSIEESVINLYDNGYKQGVSTGYYNVDRHYTVRTGEITIVTGIPGHGKSEFIDALMMNIAMGEDWKFAIYSPENQPLERHAAKLIEKKVGKPFNKDIRTCLSKYELSTTLNEINKHFTFIYPKNDDEHKIDIILNLCKVVVMNKGIKGLLIDPWNELDHSRPHGLSETEYISQCLSKIRRFARLHDIHIWLIAHPTKLMRDKDGKYPVPSPYDISGSAHWRNKADNCITVWRNVQNHDSDVEIHVQKVRFKEIGSVGMAKLRYNYANGRYSDSK